MTALSSSPAPTEPEIVLTSTFAAPRTLVFEAWTEKDRLSQWWGPKGLAIRVAEFDPRPGGIFHYCMQFPDGKEWWGKFVYREITAPERIVFINSFSDEAGHITRHPLSPTWPMEAFNTLTLTEHEGTTTVTLQCHPFNATEEERQTFEAGREYMQKGFAGTWEQLAAYLARA